MSASDFGKKAMRDPNLVFEMRKGRELRRESWEKVAAFIAEARKQDSSPTEPLPEGLSQ